MEVGSLSCRNESSVGTSGSQTATQFKRRRISCHVDSKTCLPVLRSPDYYVYPSLDAIAMNESIHAGYCARVPDFVVGRVGYGVIRFYGKTDVRWLDIEKVVKFSRHSVVVYSNEDEKPPVGYGLNKFAEVTLVLKSIPTSISNRNTEAVVMKLKRYTERQGAQFVSFDSLTGEWRFLVNHFSRFGLDEEEEEDIFMDDAMSEKDTQTEEFFDDPIEVSLSHSLPAHLGLDPKKMQEMKAILFHAEENEEPEQQDPSFLSDRRYAGREHFHADSPISLKSPLQRSPLHGSFKRSVSNYTPLRKAPQALLEYHHVSEATPPQNILMSGHNRRLPPRTMKAEGFKMEWKDSSFIGDCKSYSSNIVDAAMFMGRSFRVGWGPNGVLVHTGSPVRGPTTGLSSIITIERVAIDNTVRDENNRVKEELVDLCFISPLNIHRSLNREFFKIQAGLFSLRIQKVVTSRIQLPHVCRDFIDVIEKQLDVSGLPVSARLIMVHQVMIWELIKVLYSERDIDGSMKLSKSGDGYNVEDMMLDKKDSSASMDSEAQPLARRADFSFWLRESVCHRVQEDVSCLNSSNDLQQILLLLTGRQLDAAVELAASMGDVRLAILLSQSGGSVINRNDMSRQLDIWRNNGLDFNFIEKDRLKIYELLAGNIQVAFSDLSIDWKRYLGLVMWYHLPPDTPLSLIIATYQELLGEGRVPHPVPIYIDEGSLGEVLSWSEGDHYDFAYYLMLLFASGETSFYPLKAMFSALSSTPDPLDYHMIWHQRAILEATGAFSSDDLHVLDMSFISQLLQLGQCQWAIYVALNMAYSEVFPYMHATVIREILFQYCETWCADAEQWQFIEDLGIPSEWMHEALATYYQYYGDTSKALEHFLKCSNWQKAHSIFMTAESHPLFLSSQHSEILKIARCIEKHKMEIANWDLGAAIFLDFYDLKSFMLEEKDLNDPEMLEKRTVDCQNLFRRMNESLQVWGSRLPVISRAVYTEMVKQLCRLLVSKPGGSISAQMSCFQTMLQAPVPEDLRSCHLQDAVSVFTYFVSSTAT